MLFVKLNLMSSNVPQIALVRQAAYLEQVVLPPRYLAPHGVKKNAQEFVTARMLTMPFRFQSAERLLKSSD